MNVWLLLIVGILVVFILLSGIIVLGWNRRLTALHSMIFASPPDELALCRECNKAWPCPTLNAIGVRKEIS